MNAGPAPCAQCGGPRTRRPRGLLIGAGLALLAAAIVAPWYARWLLLPAVFPALAGGYLILWGTVGKGLWCRRCKTF